MDEATWLICTDSNLMLSALEGKASSRKFRLFACACCRKMFHPFQSNRFHQAVEGAEQYADKLTTMTELEALFQTWASVDPRRLSGGERCEARAIRGALMTSAELGAKEAAQALGELGISSTGLIRCIFSNPAQPLPLVEPRWLSWNDKTIPKLAQVIYDERTFDRLPILADALEEAGCTNGKILNHSRNHEEHIRGCQVVDFILGK